MSDSSIIFIEMLRREKEKVERKLFQPPGECMNTDKEENKKMREKISFGEYFDAQYERLREMMSNKDRKQHKEWEEVYNNKRGKKDYG